VPQKGEAATMQLLCPKKYFFKCASFFKSIARNIDLNVVGEFFFFAQWNRGERRYEDILSS
jgi:hypothetical protein